MNKALQLRRGTTAQHLEFTGLQGEVTVDTDKNTILLHDGETVGGIEFARLDYVDNQLALKSNISNSLAGYGILDAYTKLQIDDTFFNKNDINTLTTFYYNIETMDGLLSVKANVGDVYSKSDVNILLHNYITSIDLAESNASLMESIDSTKFAKAGGSISGNVTIEGDLVVTGTTSTISAENLVISDNFIYLNDGAAQGTNVDIGFAGGYNDGTYHHAGMFRDATDGRFKFFDSYVPEPNAAVNIDTSHVSFSLAPVQAESFIGDGSLLTGIDRFPIQANNANKFLMTNGTNTSWENIPGIPTQVSDLQNDSNFQTLGDVTTALESFAPKDNPTFTGTVTAPSFSGSGVGITGVVKSAQESAVGTVISNMIKLTQIEYDGLAVKNPSTLYIIV